MVNVRYGHAALMKGRVGERRGRWICWLESEKLIHEDLSITRNGRGLDALSLNGRTTILVLKKTTTSINNTYTIALTTHIILQISTGTLVQKMQKKKCLSAGKISTDFNDCD